MATDAKLFIISDRELYVRADGETHRFPLDLSGSLTSTVTAQCSACGAAAMILGLSAEQAGLAAIAALTTNQPYATVQQLCELGQKIREEHVATHLSTERGLDDHHRLPSLLTIGVVLAGVAAMLNVWLQISGA